MCSTLSIVHFILCDITCLALLIHGINVHVLISDLYLHTEKLCMNNIAVKRCTVSA